MKSFGRLATRHAQKGIVVPGLLLISFLTTMAGCGRPEARFKLNTVHVAAQEAAVGTELSRSQQRNLATVLTAMFGTPDEPLVPQMAEADASTVVDLEKLELSAGPVRMEELGPRGLYREHCVHCHGISGDGAGPTASFLNPYPRDYRRGTFKFKTTKGLEPPTHDDLKRILVNGIPGTAMPSFKVLDDGQLDALVHYVKYLSIRGQIERRLIEAAADELEEDELFLDDSDPESEVFQARRALIEEELGTIIASWQDVESTEVPAPPENWTSPEFVAKGQDLFFTDLTNCSQCHGDTALGDGELTNFDDWTKDWYVEGIRGDADAIHEFERLGAMPPRNIRPRNLRQNVYRGGRRPVDLFLRVKNGIAGVGMPAATKLSDDEIWSVIAYVRTLPYESISQPRHIPEFQRDLP